MIQVIIPAYNCVDTIRNTLNSLVAQTQKRFFVLIVDDCSEEDLFPIYKEYKEKLNLNYYRLKENGGCAVARQRGLELSERFDHILFLDADDMLMPNAIEILNRESKINNADVIASEFIQQNKYGVDRVIKQDQGTTWLHGKLYKNSFLKENNIGFCTKIRVNEDGNFNTKVFNMTDKIYALPMITTIWIDNKNSITRGNNDFAAKSIPDYIRGQVDALNYLIDNQEWEKIEHTFINTIVYIYKFYEAALYNKFEVSKEILWELSLLLNRLPNEIWGDKKFNEKLSYALHDRSPVGEVYFEEETFTQFLDKIRWLYNE